MLVLAGPLVEVAPGQDVSHLQAKVVVGLARQLRKVFVSEVAVHV
jgi:hypothetical protein